MLVSLLHSGEFPQEAVLSSHTHTPAHTKTTNNSDDNSRRTIKVLWTWMGLSAVEFHYSMMGWSVGLIFGILRCHYEILQFLPGRHAPKGLYVTVNVWGTQPIRKVSILLGTPQLSIYLGFCLVCHSAWCPRFYISQAYFLQKRKMPSPAGEGSS